MNKVGIFFGSLSGNTQLVAEIIQSKLPKGKADLYDIFDTDLSVVQKYDNIIFGLPTWGKLIINDDWQEFMESLQNLNLKSKNVALFGLGDQVMFSSAFADSMGVIYQSLLTTGCDFVGKWPSTGYEFEESYALVNDRFCGLVIDEDNQSELTEKRIDEWLKMLLSQFA